MIPEVIKWDKMPDQVYRNIMAFFTCKGCCFAGIPVEEEVEKDASEGKEQTDLDNNQIDEDEGGGVSLLGYHYGNHMLMD